MDSKAPLPSMLAGTNYRSQMNTKQYEAEFALKTAPFYPNACKRFDEYTKAISLKGEGI